MNFPQNIADQIAALESMDEFGTRYEDTKAKPSTELVQYFVDNFNIKTDVHRMCVVCQIRQIAKYRKTPVEGFDVDKFMVKCNYVPQGLPEGSRDKVNQIAVELGIPIERAEKIVLATIDPVAWAELVFGFDDKTKGAEHEWYLRSYQKEELRCTARRMVLRQGRRCVIGDTPILMADGQWRPIKTVRPGDEVISWVAGSHERQQVADFYANGLQPVYRITLENGLAIEVTANHPLMAKRVNGYCQHHGRQYGEGGWLTIEGGLQKGDKLLVSEGYKEFGILEDLELAGFLGFMLTDGSVTNTQSPKFTNNNLLYHAEVTDFVHRRFGITPKMYSKSNGWDQLLTQEHGTVTTNPIRSFFKDLGIAGLKAHDKKIPSIIWSLNKPSIARFLNRLLAGDGCVSFWSKGRSDKDFGIEISLTTASQQMTVDLQSLLLRLGIYSKVTKENRTSPTGFQGVTYKVRVCDHVSVKKFLAFTGPVYGKEEQCEAVLEIIRKYKEPYAERRPSFKLDSDGEFAWFKIKSIESIGEKETFDIEVPGPSNFIANGFVSHNSGKSFGIALKLLHKAFNRVIAKGTDSRTGQILYSGPEIIIACPYSPQVANIFEEMEKLILRSDEIKSQVELRPGDAVFTKSPIYRIDFKNGGVIKGFVTGTGERQDGAAGGTIRGASANIIYLDEVDMISESIMTSVIKPLLLSGKAGELYTSSTPIGKRSLFYEWCTASPDWREFYFPSTVLDQWEEIKSELMRELAKGGSREQFEAEYLAKFVDSEYGVFKPSQINEARADYCYEDAEKTDFWYKKGPRSEMIRCIGIDWNKNAGTEFYVTAFFPSTGMFYGIDATNIPASQFSAEMWREELKRLNYKWKPHFIYADEGYGHTIIEDLRLEASKLYRIENRSEFQNETVKLLDRIKSYNFSSNVELRDPVSREVIKKPAKLFLVENAIRILESYRFKFPYGDERLAEQMSRYVVLRQSIQTGKPLYGPESDKIGDHRLDAWMLSITGIVLECGNYTWGGGTMPISEPGFLEGNVPTGIDEFNRQVKDNDLFSDFNTLQILRGQKKLTKRRSDFSSQPDIQVPPEAYARDEEDAFRAAIAKRQRTKPQPKRRMF